MFSFSVLILKGLDTITHDEAVRKAFCTIIILLFSVGTCEVSAPKFKLLVSTRVGFENEFLFLWSF